MQLRTPEGPLEESERGRVWAQICNIIRECIGATFAALLPR